MPTVTRKHSSDNRDGRGAHWKSDGAGRAKGYSAIKQICSSWAQVVLGRVSRTVVVAVPYARVVLLRMHVGR